MVILSSRATADTTSTPTDDEPFNRSARVIVDLLDAAGNVWDGDHLQCIAFLAQEFGLVDGPHFLFGAAGPEPHRPHSLLLEGHFYALMREGLIDVDATGRLRLRRDLYPMPAPGLVRRRLSALAALSPMETAVFASAVLCLAQEGRHAGSPRHDDAFHAAVTAIAASSPLEEPVDVAAIVEARRGMRPADPVMLIPV